MTRLTDLLRAAGQEKSVREEFTLEGANDTGTNDTGAGNIVVTGFAIDHRKVAPGTVFGAFDGARCNGEDFIPAALAAGAIAVVARPEAFARYAMGKAMALPAVNPRFAFAHLAAGFFQPVPETLMAVTGTNGKTSTVEMLRQIWRMTGRRSASIGTLGVTTGDESVSTGLTSPDIVTFLANLTGLAREGVSHVAFEASSHGLAQYRCEGPKVSAGAFTNLSRDHLDYHGDMEAYFVAKMRLFDEVVADGGSAVVWTDAASDDKGEGDKSLGWSLRAIEHARERSLRLLTVGPAGDTIRLVRCKPGPLGQTLDIELGEPFAKFSTKTCHRIILPLIGAYQVANALVAGALALVDGIKPEAVFDALSRLAPIRGRLERAALTRVGAPVYVDYAHTPDALEAAIQALRVHGRGRLIVVFGAGGDRDRGKRSAMGRAVATLADVAIISDDNPRGEDAASIRSAILEGARGARAIVHEIGDRRAAIGAALGMACADDMVLIAGKGHEQGQIIGAGAKIRILPFDDVTVARECAGELI